MRTLETQVQQLQELRDDPFRSYGDGEITEKLKLLVTQEAILLRHNATQAERDHLNFNEVNPWFSDECIYGQMTGSCQNKRAAELLESCAYPYSVTIARYSEPLGHETFAVRPERIGIPVFSAIEYYIVQRGAKLGELIDFLKCKTDKLEL